MFKWLQCVWNFLFIWQAMWNYLSIHKMSPLVSFLSSSPLTTKTYKVTKTITNQVWKWFWLPESITNTNSDEQESLRLNLRHNFSIDISMILLRMKKKTSSELFPQKHMLTIVCCSQSINISIGLFFILVLSSITQIHTNIY